MPNWLRYNSPDDPASALNDACGNALCPRCERENARCACPRNAQARVLGETALVDIQATLRTRKSAKVG